MIAPQQVGLIDRSITTKPFIINDPLLFHCSFSVHSLFFAIFEQLLGQQSLLLQLQVDPLLILPQFISLLFQLL